MPDRMLAKVRALLAKAESTTFEREAEALTARAQEAAAAARVAFPHTRDFSPSASDGEGRRAGTVFGDLADLSVASRLERRSA